MIDKEEYLKHIAAEFGPFATEKEAEYAMFEYLDEDCSDNYRFSFVDDEEGLLRYEMIRVSGCCGSYNAKIIVGGKPAIIGCNFGH